MKTLQQNKSDKTFTRLPSRVARLILVKAALNGQPPRAVPRIFVP